MQNRPLVHREVVATGPYSAICLLFFISGAGGLIYEILWTRNLALVLGTSSLAGSVVLAVFLGGLSVGSALASRQRLTLRRPLRAYALLELGIGVYAACIPAALSIGDVVQRALGARVSESFALTVFVDALVAAIVLFPPTAAMGATLPILSQLCATSGRRTSSRIGFLYGVNTFGAVIGAVLCGFVLLRSLGADGTLYLAVGMNVAVAAAAWGLDRRRSEASPAVETTRAPEIESALSSVTTSSSVRRTMRVAVLLSGAAALACEVLWFRMLTLTLSSTIYAFSGMLATFLAGLAAGGTIGAAGVTKVRHPARMYARLQIAAAWAICLSYFLFFQVPQWRAMWAASGQGPMGGLLLRLAPAAIVIIPPAIILGMLFPFALAAVGPTAVDARREVGWLYAFNTLGTIFGSLGAGLVLIPLLTVENAWIVVVSIQIATAMLVMAKAGDASGRHIAWTGLIGLATVVGLVWLRPSWSGELGGRFSSPTLTAAAGDDWHEGARASQLASRNVAWREGRDATLTVVQTQGRFLWLRTNGLNEGFVVLDPASTRLNRTASALGLLPIGLHGGAKRVCLIGLGAGGTLQAIETTGVEEIVCVELLPEVVGMVRDVLYPPGGAMKSPLEDARVRLIVNDARHVLRNASRTYDVIISQPSHPWLAGSSGVFTREFLEIVAVRLTKGGVFCQWFPQEHMNADALLGVLATVRSAFAHVATFEIETQVVILASDKPIRADLSRFGDFCHQPRVAEHLGQLDWSPFDLLKDFAFEEHGIEQLCEQAHARINTDANAFLETELPLIYEANVLADGPRFSMSEAYASERAGLSDLLTGQPPSRAMAEECLGTLLVDGRFATATALVRAPCMAEYAGLQPYLDELAGKGAASSIPTVLDRMRREQGSMTLAHCLWIYGQLRNDNVAGAREGLASARSAGVMEGSTALANLDLMASFMEIPTPESAGLVESIDDSADPFLRRLRHRALGVFFASQPGAMHAAAAAHLQRHLGIVTTDLRAAKSLVTLLATSDASCTDPVLRWCWAFDTTATLLDSYAQRGVRGTGELSSLIELAGQWQAGSESLARAAGVSADDLALARKVIEHHLNRVQAGVLNSK